MLLATGFLVRNQVWLRNSEIMRLRREGGHDLEAAGGWLLMELSVAVMVGPVCVTTLLHCFTSAAQPHSIPVLITNHSTQKYSKACRCIYFLLDWIPALSNVYWFFKEATTKKNSIPSSRGLWPRWQVSTIFIFMMGSILYFVRLSVDILCGPRSLFKRGAGPIYSTLHYLSYFPDTDLVQCAVELQTKVIRRYAKILQSCRRPLLGTFPGWKHLLALSHS